MNLSKKDIAKKLSKKFNLTTKDSMNLLNKFLYIIKENLKTNSVKLSKFGTFIIQKTPQRLGRNPKTGESYIIKARNRVAFKPSKSLKKDLN